MTSVHNGAIEWQLGPPYVDNTPGTLMLRQAARMQTAVYSLAATVRELGEVVMELGEMVGGADVRQRASAVVEAAERVRQSAMGNT